jgi:hypothetical protein
MEWNMKTKVATTTKQGIDEAVEQLRQEIQDNDARLIVYFASSLFDPASTATKMAAAFPGVPTIGCTTAGEIGAGRMSERSIVAMALGSEVVKRVEVRLLRGVTEDARGNVVRAFDDISAALGQDMGALDPERYVGLIFTDGLSGAEERLMDAIGDRTNVHFVGGSAGDDLKFQKAQVFAGGTAAPNACAIAVIETLVPFTILKTQSFRVLPQRLTATKVNEPRRHVIEFNGEPAAQAYAKAVGVPVAEASSRFMTNPVGLLAGEGIFVRSPQRIEGDTVYFYCSILEGMELAVLESTDIVADTEKALATIPDATAILDFDCILRTLELRQKKLCDRYGGLFAKIPTVGFSTYGEAYIGHINQTSTMLVFRSR